MGFVEKKLALNSKFAILLQPLRSKLLTKPWIPKLSRCRGSVLTLQYRLSLGNPTQVSNIYSSNVISIATKIAKYLKKI